MRQLRAIIVVSIVLGVLSLSIPLKFYAAMSSIFGSLSPSPFDFGVVRIFTFVFALPAITLILMGIAIYYITVKLEKVAELEVITEGGESLGGLKKVKVEHDHVESLITEDDMEIEKKDVLGVDDTVIVKVPENEFEGKEVYSEVGDFLGYVKCMKTDDEDEVVSIEVEKKDKCVEISVRDVISADMVVIVKA